MEQHREKHLGLLVVLHAEKVLEQGQMSGTGDGQELGDPLQHPHQDGKEIGQEKPSYTQKDTNIILTQAA
jgi:hypothetical protein